MLSLEGEELYFEKGKNLLGEKYGITLTKEIVEETTITRLDGDAKNGKKTISISGTMLSDPNGILDSYLGRKVIVATHENNDGVIVLAWLTRKDEEVIIPAGNLNSSVSDIRSGRIRTIDDNKEETYPLEDGFYVISNGVANPYYDPSDLLLKNGSLRLLDNNRDGVYEVVFIELYSLHYVSGAFSDEKELTIVDSNGVRKTVQRESLSVTNGAGSVMSVSKITKDTVIKLFETPDGGHCRIILYNQSISGQITEISQETVEIDGASYDLSLFYQDNIPEPKPTVNDYVRVFVNETNEALWLERDAEESEAEWTIAFSQATDISGSLASEIRFRMFNEKGKWLECGVADNVRVDGYSMEKGKLADLIREAQKNGTALYEKAFLRYKLDNDSNIKAIDTTQTTAGETTPSFTKMEENIAAGLYSKEAASFWLQHKMIGRARNDTPTFVIPVVGGQYTTDSSCDNLYQVSTVLNVAGNRSSKTQNLEQYMPDEYGYPACFVKKRDMPNLTRIR